MMIMEDGYDWATDSIYMAVKPSSNYLAVSIETDGTGFFGKDDIEVSNLDEAWNQVIYSYNGSKIDVYFNGNNVFTKDFSGNLISGDENLHFGRRPGGKCSGEECFFAGDLDDMRIYNRAMDSEEVTQLYNYQRTIDPHGVDAHLKMAQTQIEFEDLAGN